MFLEKEKIKLGSMKKYKKKVIQDCEKAVTPAAVFNILNEITGLLLSIYTATVLGKFTDAIFRLDFSYGVKNFWELLLCVGISLFIIPTFATVKEILLFSNSLKHDRLIYGRYLDKKYREAILFTEGEVQYRLEQDAIDLRCAWMDIITKYISIPVTLIYLLYNSLHISLLYTLVVFLISIFKLVVPIAIRKLNEKYDKETREYKTIVRDYETEITSKPHLIKLYGLSTNLINRLNQIYLKYFHNVFRKSVKCTVIAQNISSILDTFCVLLILLVGAFMIVTRTITSGEMVTIIGFFSIFNILIENIGFLIRNIPVFNTILERMMLFYKDEENLEGKTIAEVKDIIASEVSFSYGETTVFCDVNFKINSGDKIAICGNNGSGKSTLIKLLCGLLKDYSGHIKINGEELADISIKSWRNQFAYTDQNPYLFTGSVRENIYLGNLEASENELDDVIREIGIEYLSSREISTGNNELSGGEKQKISIARALLKKTPILIMDEPSNNLDENTIQWLREFIVKSSKTIIFISHDSYLLSSADYIVYM